MNRRRFLGGVAGAATVATAGCSLLGSESSGASGGLAPADEWFLTGDEQSATGGTFSASLTYPERLQRETTAVSQAAIDARLDSTIPPDSGLAMESIEVTAVVFPAADVGPRMYNVTLGEFDREAVVESLQAAGLSDEGTAGGFRLLLRTGPEEKWFAVDDGRVITAPHVQGRYDRPREALVSVIDTGNGDRPRALDRWDAPAEIAGRLPDGGEMTLRYQESADESGYEVGSVRGADARGTSWALEDERVVFTTIYHLVDGREIGDELTESLSSTPSARVELLDQTVDGRFVETRFTFSHGSD